MRYADRLVDRSERVHHLARARSQTRSSVRRAGLLSRTATNAAPRRHNCQSVRAPASIEPCRVVLALIGAWFTTSPGSDSHAPSGSSETAVRS
jgi:hypothetical protein